MSRAGSLPSGRRSPPGVPGRSRRRWRPSRGALDRRSRPHRTQRRPRAVGRDGGHGTTLRPARWRHASGSWRPAPPPSGRGEVGADRPRTPHHHRRLGNHDVGLRIPAQDGTEVQQAQPEPGSGGCRPVPAGKGRSAATRAYRPVVGRGAAPSRPTPGEGSRRSPRTRPPRRRERIVAHRSAGQRPPGPDGSVRPSPPFFRNAGVSVPLTRVPIPPIRDDALGGRHSHV